MRWTLDEVEARALAVLRAAGASAAQAGPVARSIRAAERDGMRSHGLLYLPIYVEHLTCGKVDGQAEPRLTQPRAGAIAVDAAHGFAHPAIDLGLPRLIEAARQVGIAALTLRRSYNCGLLGHHAEQIAGAGLIGLCFTHAPASISPVGGKVPVIGTNPFALAVPDGQGGARFVIDQSASVVAKSEVLLRARQGKPIPEGWALDAEGQPTTDAEAGLKGSMLPAGGVKGFGIGLMVEVLASALAGAEPSRTASPFSGPVGGPPATGQCFIAIDPAAHADGFTDRIAALAEAITVQQDARLPGARRRAARIRTEAEGVELDEALMARLRLQKN
ncbi:Ldh family oxidoreductase [Szabonella alba]|uniref:Ldh family oxidoreductase n=1 Tax=Szabonella alba TaxID=2804194 RepID=A0A8K0V6W9_9RHOB|nr:Ldh family oxidoreductase [Szabonella alba]MBL4916552.1 Ldh family oxidoreductase [Szabonella alba]